MNLAKSYRVKPGSKVSLRKFKTDDPGGLTKKQALARFKKLRQRLIELQELMYAEGKHGLLVVFQAMDCGGKDSTIGTVFRGVNPQGCKVASFKAPNEVELRHDFLWRVHQGLPRRGTIGIFNRSHYEDVLIVRVDKLQPDKRWKEHYQQINAFEQMLHDEGTTIVKFFLHISKGYQKKRLQRRLDDPAKHWKFSPADLVERKKWSDYQDAYEQVFERCSTDAAPWYIIPAERRWYRNLLIASVLVDTLESLDMKYPKADFDPQTIVIPD
jgi:PPK2 family polyphosphate:nucleotide phosphotransferase